MSVVVCVCVRVRVLFPGPAHRGLVLQQALVTGRSWLAGWQELGLYRGDLCSLSWWQGGWQR